MDLQPVPGIPALCIDEYLIIGDLHIGVEAHLMSKGFHLTSRTDIMYEAILEAAGTITGKIIVLGDVKDSVPGSTKQEYREIPAFFDRLIEQFDSVDVVRGNHDTGIEEFLPGKVTIRSATGFTIGDIGLIHGHTWPSNDVMTSKTLVMAHEHPAIMFKDGIGKHSTEPCWLRGKFYENTIKSKFETLPEDFVVIPAFNRMLGGSPVNVNGTSFLGPVMNSGLLDLDNASVHLLDGVFLGKRSDLMIDGRISFNRKNKH